MGAPVGNNFWELRSRHGVQKLFESPELMWGAACEYFTYCVQNPLLSTEYFGKDAEEKLVPKVQAFTLHGLCLYLGCSTSYFRVFKFNISGKEGGITDIDEGFLTVITRIEETIFQQKFIHAAAGMLKENLIARDLGIADKSENKNENHIIVTVEE